MKLSTLQFSEDCYEIRLLMLKFGVEYELIPVNSTAEAGKSNMAPGDRDSSNDYPKLPEPNQNRLR